MARLIDLTGKRFGRLVVLGYAGRERSRGGHSRSMWYCECDCGEPKTLSTGNLTSGNTRSCGCLKTDRNVEYFTTHGMSKTKLYSVWGTMKDRCYSPDSKGYQNYGGRGIEMCQSWKDSFKNFYEWAIKSGYKDGVTIERKDVNGNYEPDNCCWIPKADQSKNRRNCHYITYHGITKTLSEWSRELHIDRECLRNKEKELGDGELAIEAILASPRHKKERDNKCSLLKQNL